MTPPMSGCARLRFAAALALVLAGASPAGAAKEMISIPVTEPKPANLTAELNPKAHEDSEKQVKRFLAAHLTP